MTSPSLVDAQLTQALEHQTRTILAELDKRFTMIDSKWEARVEAAHQAAMGAIAEWRPRVDASIEHLQQYQADEDAVGGFGDVGAVPDPVEEVHVDKPTKCLMGVLNRETYPRQGLQAQPSSLMTLSYDANADDDEVFTGVLDAAFPTAFNDDSTDSNDIEGFYAWADAEDTEAAPPASSPLPWTLSSLIHHTLAGDVVHAAFDPVRHTAVPLRGGGGHHDAKQLVPDTTFSAFFHKSVVALASTRDIVGLHGASSAAYYIANPATFARERLPDHGWAGFVVNAQALWEETGERPVWVRDFSGIEDADAHTANLFVLVLDADHSGQLASRTQAAIAWSLRSDGLHEEEDEVLNALPNRCLMNCFILIWSYFSPTLCWKIPWPPPFSLESLYTGDHASFSKEIAATDSLEHLNSLRNVLQARGEHVVSPGFGRPYVFNAEMLKRVRHTSEAKDSARVALKSPWWTLGCSYEEDAELPSLLDRCLLLLIWEDCTYHMSASAVSHLMDLEDLYFSRLANIGVFICLQCYGVHRSVGTHVSKVLSVTLDQWTDDEINSMIEVGGNSYANAIYEALLPEDYEKLHPNSSQEERAEFIRSKYELQEFVKPSLVSSYKGSLGDTSSQKHTDNFVFPSASFSSEARMVEIIGILKVKVIRGTKLAVRDLMSSNPYVVLNLGQQKAKTSVSKCNQNPVWNEEFKLSVYQQCGPLKLQVFDHGTLSKDNSEARILVSEKRVSMVQFKTLEHMLLHSGHQDSGCAKILHRLEGKSSFKEEGMLHRHCQILHI
jgi:hypothetical protein